MLCFLLGQDNRWAFTGPLILWFKNGMKMCLLYDICDVLIFATYEFLFWF